MLEAMLEGWRGRRVLIVGDQNGLCAFLIAVLEEIGTRPTCISDRADAQTFCRALTAGRIGAVILPGEMTGGGLPERLAATMMLTAEIREAGVPLLMALSDAPVYRGGACRMSEAEPIGGRTREGLEASILQMALGGAARGLLGDPVRTLLIRHAPILGGQYAAWCDALLAHQAIDVHHPTARGVFVHPLDVVCCALTLGAAALRRGEGGVYNLGTDARHIDIHRNAARRFAARHHGMQTLHEIDGKDDVPALLLDGGAMRRLCGAGCRLDVDQALDLLLEQRRAAREGQEAEAIRRLTRTYLEGCRA